MRKLKKVLVNVLCILTIAFGVAGLAACESVYISPDGSGGIVVTPGGNGDGTQTPGDGQGSSAVGGNGGGTQSSHQHLWSGGSITKKPTCEEMGEKTYRCLLCDEKVVEELDALGHDTVRYEAKAATCTESGWEEYERCDREGCDYTTYEEIEATEHDTVKYAAKAATCTEPGWEEYEACENCDYTTYEEIRALGHDRVRYAAKAATCTEGGYEAYEVCEREGCSHTTYKEIAALGHDLRVYEKQEATCTKDGWESYEVCNRCDHKTPFVTIAATGHAYKNKVCTSCGAAEPNHEHVWNEGDITKTATCTEKGEKTYTCENCEEKKMEIIPLKAHDNKSFEEKAATCEEKGWFSYTVCQSCGYSTYVEIPALGHSYDKGVVTMPATCEKAGVMTYSCLCGKTYTEMIEAKGHAYGAWSVTTAATCEKAGEETRVCANDEWHKETRSIKAIGHNYGEWVQVQEPTCAVEGQEERVCKNDLLHVETRSISKTTEHNVGADGKCLVCKKLINNKLNTPVISFEDETSIGWAMITNAEAYLVYILPNDEMVQVNQPEISLEPYFAGNKTLRVQVKAIVSDDSEYVNSEYSELYVYTIQGETIVGTKGVGDAVNLLTGGYTEFADGTTKIFDETLFNRLRLAEDTSVKKQQTVVTYEESLDGYLDKLTGSVNNKTSVNASVGYAKVAKATMGFEFEVGAKYETSTYSQTQAVFYDMDYYYINKKMEIYGYNDTEKLASILSATFLADAKAVADSKMTPADFIAKYGTHIVTSGIYGAKFNAHYELLTSKDTADDMFGTNIKSTISAGISGSLYGIEVGVDTSNSTEVKNEHFVSETNENKQSKFTATAIGGSAQGMNATTLAEVAAASEKWAAGLDDTNCVLIDVPDNSLFFVWDFLGEEYQETKDVLSEYFFDQCDESYYALKDKLSSLYSESAIFDEERGILTVNFAGLQSYEKASLEGVSYTKESNGIDFNGKTLTLYSSINDVPVQKIIFKGNYYKTDRHGQLRTNHFSGLTIKFDQWWSQDIVLEFESFAYEAPSGYTALDFSAVSSNNIVINVVGQSYIKGGAGARAGADGLTAIAASGKNVTIVGGESFTVVGGNGINATSTGGKGGNGGIGLIAETISIDSVSALKFIGGNGAAGATGSNGSRGSDGTNGADYTSNAGGVGGNGTAGKVGGKGGNGASALKATSLAINNSVVTAQSGNGGAGGTGGAGGQGGQGGRGGSNYNFFNCSAGVGGAGGYGGTGGAGGAGGDVSVAVAVSAENVVGTVTTINGKVGVGGTGGTGGYGGAGGQGGLKCTGAGGLYDSVTMKRMASGASRTGIQAGSGAKGANGVVLTK